MTIQPMLLTFLILIVTTFFFIQEKVRSDLVAFGSLLALTLTNVITPKEALAGFSNSVVIMIAGLFIVGAGIFNTGLAKSIGHSLLKWGGNSEIKLLLIVMLTVGVFSGFLSNTGTVAVLLPVVMSMAMELKISPSRFLIPLAFASSLGGVLTLIGTPPNLVVSGMLKESGFEKLSFFDFTGIGLVALGAGLLFMVIIGRKLLPNHDFTSNISGKEISAGELAGMYKIYDQLHFVHVPEASEIVGERLLDLKLPVRYEITVIEIERKHKEKLALKNPKQSIVARADEILHPQDLLLVFGVKEKVDSFIKDYELERKEFNLEDIKRHFLSRTYGMTEIIITPHSSFENKSLIEIHFREKYQCSVLAINRKGDYIQTDVANEKLKHGDALLVHGKWDNIEKIAKNTHDVVVLGTVSKEASRAYASGKAPIAAGIMLFMLALMTFEVISPVIAVLVAAFLMIVTGCIRSIEEAYTMINWESIILIAAMLPMATALEKTGGIMFISDLMLKALGGFGPYGILVGFYLATMLLSQFISNTATAVIFAPIALTTAVSMGISPYPLLICVAVAASMAFSTPIASPTNALVMTAGGYSFKDFVKIGVPLQIFIGVFMIIAIPLFFPF
ncbi:SLC13 family permease [Peribacillus tepidiphilus]|uniref:SLC13 family permease n=1 Tax=Peribacillus tepidiphilus TaxID=2652445 RepID=UPI0012909BE6|nr:SLC13 family permease [Peribacillus tepidiphilus]